MVVSSWLRHLFSKRSISLGVASLVATALMLLIVPVAWAATSIGSSILTVSSLSANATKVTQAVTFVATSGLTTTSTITLVAPTGTVFAPTSGCSPDEVMDQTTGSSQFCETATITGGNQVVITSGITAAAGDTVSVYANAVTNTSTTGAQNLSVSTSNDATVVQLPFTITAASAVSAATLSVSSKSATATM
jgi:hypothetical protein